MMAAVGGWQRASTAGDVVDKLVKTPSSATPFTARGRHGGERGWKRKESKKCVVFILMEM